MSWWGKVIGGAFGFMVGGPLGAALGVALGHNFDRGLEGVQLPGGDQERVQTAFFTACFSVMGAVAKADGQVSKAEIRVAENMMQQMRLTADMRAAAINLFDQGKQADFPLDEILDQFRQECHRRQNLLQMFMEIQLQAAYADGRMDAAEDRMMRHICARLGFPELLFRQLDTMVRLAMGLHAQGEWQGRYSSQQGHQEQAQQSRASRSDMSISEAYAVLGITSSATDAEVKKAYRRLMSQHHPDRLVSKGLPEEMMELAKQKTQQIRKAYEIISAARGTR